MILGFSHVVRNCVVMDHEMAGRSPVFREVLPNHPSKWPYLTEGQELHEIMLCREGMQVEYVAYRHLSKPEGRFSVDGQVVSLASADLGKSRELWCAGLGLKAEGNEFRFVSPVPAWRLTLKMFEAPSSLPKLDCAGVSALSFVSNNLEADRDRLSKHGAELLMEPFVIKVNGKTLRVEIVRGTSNEFIELIQVLQ